MSCQSPRRIPLNGIDHTKSPKQRFVLLIASDSDTGTLAIVYLAIFVGYQKHDPATRVGYRHNNDGHTGERARGPDSLFPPTRSPSLPQAPSPGPSLCRPVFFCRYRNFFLLVRGRLLLSRAWIPIIFSSSLLRRHLLGSLSLGSLRLSHSQDCLSRVHPSPSKSRGRLRLSLAGRPGPVQLLFRVRVCLFHGFFSLVVSFLFARCGLSAARVALARAAALRLRRHSGSVVSPAGAAAQ
jgi:hypothetical protein